MPGTRLGWPEPSVRTYAAGLTPACSRASGLAGVTGRAARDVALLGGTPAVLIAGTPAAQDRQVPPQRPLDVLGHLLLVSAVAVLVGRRRWPVATFTGSVVLVGAYSGRDTRTGRSS